MKLKKILAVALAATTALSSGVSYDLLSASKAYANVGAEKDETFTETINHVTYTYQVTDEAVTTTSGGNVKLTAVESDDTDEHPLKEFNVYKTAFDDSSKVTYTVKEVELDGTSFNELGDLSKINIGDATNLKKVVMKNFDDSANTFNIVTSGSATGVAANLEEVDFTNSNISFTKIMGFVGGSTAKLETLKAKSLTGNSDATNSTDKTLDLRAFKNLKTVDLSENDVLTTVKVERGEVVASGSTVKTPYAMTLNINGDTNIETLYVKGGYSKAVKDNDGALVNGNKGVTFITDDSEEGSRTVDLSAYSIKDLTINGAGIEGLTVPGDAVTVDVSDNFLTSLDVSAGSDIKTLNASNNMLLDIDVAGLGEATSINLASNYLTALDVSNCEKFTSGTAAKDNFIPKDNFVKASTGQSGVSVGEQRKPDVVAMALTGDGGLKSNKGDNANGIIKIGGSANVVAAFVVKGAPEGFAEKYAETITWKEANENGGAFSLGEASVTGTQYKYDGNGNTYNYGQARVFVTAPITAADVKTAQEKITITAGNIKNSISVQADNAILISYDVASNLPTNKIADEGDNEYLKEFGMVFAPQQAAILPSSGTASVKLDSVVPSIFTSDAFGLLKGVQVDSWNTAADGSGTSYKFSGVNKGKTAKLSEDTVLTAIYKEKTFTVSFDKGNYYSGGKTSGSAPAGMKNLNWGDEVNLSANGWSSTVKISSDSSDTNDNTFMAWIEKDGGCKAYEDSSPVFGGKLGVASKYSDKKGTANLKALWGNGNFSMTLENNSVTLGLLDTTKNTYKLDDVDATIDAYDPDKVTKQDKDLVAYTSNDGVVAYTNGYLYAKGEGTATVYVYDQANGAAATISVTVNKDGNTSTDTRNADLAEGKAVKADNGETVKLNTDGKTVTLNKGKNKKTVKINTVTIDGVTYKVTAIAANAFKGMSKIQTVVVGNNVKTIGKLAFANCKNLKKVTMGKNVKKIGAKAFKNDKKLAKVLIKSKKLTKNSTVGSQAFKSTKSGAKFYIAKKAATFKKIKKVIKKKGQPTKAVYKKKFA
jgi:hypothetical protein